jgi:uncharacterized membrane protein YgaE (UPF0421/DUF939 family)
MLLDFRIYSFLVLFVIMIPLFVKIHVIDGIGTASVIVMHVYLFLGEHPNLTWRAIGPFLMNELALILVGTGVALVVNFYMPTATKRMQRYNNDINHLIAAVLREYGAYLRNGYTLWDGAELLTLGKEVHAARSLARMDEENMRRSEYRQLFDEKRQQHELLERMLAAVSLLEVRMEQGTIVSDFIDNLADYYDHLMLGQTQGAEEAEKRETQYLHLALQMTEIREQHKHLPMPQTRYEFEQRASLFTLTNELERLFNTL